MSVLAYNLTLSLARSLLILSLLGLTLNPLPAFQQSATQKTKYEFTDTRVLEADSLLKKRQYEQALKAYETAYDQFEKEAFYEGMVYVKERMGRAYWMLGKDSLSSTFYQEAATMANQRLGEFHVLESKALTNNSIRLYTRGNYKSATRIIDKAMSIYENSSKYDFSLYKSLIDYKFYSYYHSGGDRDTLIKYLNLRAEFFDKNSPNLNNQVFLMSDYSRAFFRRGEFFKSVTYGLEALRIAESGSEIVGDYYYRDAMFNLSNALYKQGNFEQALDIAEKLISYTKRVRPNGYVQVGYFNLKAVILNGLEKYNEASQEFLNALHLLEQLNDKRIVYRTTAMNLGVCYELMGELELARNYLTLALKAEKNSGQPFSRDLSSRYKYLGQYYRTAKDHEKSLAYYDSALWCYIGEFKTGLFELPERTKIDPTYEALNLLRNKVGGLIKTGELSNDPIPYLKATIDYTLETHDFLIDNREEIQASSERLFLSEVFRDLYEYGIRAAHLLIEYDPENSANYLDVSFRLFNYSKSVLFFEQADELNSVQSNEIPANLRMSFYREMKKLDSLESEFINLTKNRDFGDSLRMVNSQLLDLGLKLEKLRGTIKSLTPNDLTQNSTDDQFLNTIAAHFNQESVVGYIEYFLGDNHIYVYNIAHGNRKLIAIEKSRELMNQIDSFVKLVSKKPTLDSFANDLEQYQTQAIYLYNTLLKPVVAGFKNSISEITLVPDGILSSLPFEALLKSISQDATGYNELDYLIKQFSFNYSLSSNQITTKTKKIKANKNLLGIGFSGQTNNELRSAYGDLPGTEEEIESIKEVIKGDFLLGVEGNKSTFLEVAGDYDILHLAVHGEADSTNRFNSSLIFNGENGVLKTRDLYVAGLNARLAILSACESGVGEINKGEGTFSIARGFALVGVPSLVMSLWKVNDKVAADLMVDLHKNLQQGSIVSVALTNTKRSYLANSDQYTGHPYYWSAFISLGEDVSIKEKKYFWIVLLITSALTLVSFVVFWQRKKKRDHN